MKLWIYVEGDSEEYLVRKGIEKHFPNVLLERDRLQFVDSTPKPGTHSYYIDNCEGVNSIPYQINETYHFIESTQSFDLVVVCDIEKELGCATSRKDYIEARLAANVNKQKIKYVFSRMTAEEIFWDYPDVVKKVIKLIYEIRAMGQPRLINIPQKPVSNHLHKFKELFKYYDLKYRESEFAELFFPRIQYSTSTNQTISRFHKFLSIYFT